MSDPATRQLLPRTVEALKFCQQRALVSGLVNLSDMPRLAAQLNEVTGAAEAELAFGVDEQGRRVVTGRISALLPLLCQRCLAGNVIAVAPELSLALVWNDEQASHLPRSLDPVVMEGQELDLYAIVEDELLLSLPLVANHEMGQCEAPMSPVLQEKPLEVEVKINPFQVLASLKTVAKDAEH